VNETETKCIAQYRTHINISESN